jgi:hypothetical protein
MNRGKQKRTQLVLLDAKGSKRGRSGRSSFLWRKTKLARKRVASTPPEPNSEPPPAAQAPAMPIMPPSPTEYIPWKRPASAGADAPFAAGGRVEP